VLSAAASPGAEVALDGGIGFGGGLPRGRSLRVAMVHLSDFRLDSRIQRQARALAERGDEVDLVCVGEREELRVGAGVIRVHPLGSEKAAGGAAAYLRDYASFLARALRRISALDAAARFDLVEIHNMPDVLTLAALRPRLRGVPVILNVHDTFPELFSSKFGSAPGGAFERILKLEERISAALATRIVVVTDQARLRLEGRGVGVGRTTVVMNSPDEGVFGPPREPVQWPADGPLRVLYHGGLAPRFGVQTAIEAFARLRESVPRLQLRVCGSGEDRDRLAALAAAIDPQRIDVAPEPVPFQQIPAELAASHIGVVPTLHDHFTELLLPVKLLEYVHMGLPIVASRLPGIASYFGDEDLTSFAPGDEQDLARAIESVCADPAAARERARSATRRLSGIAWESQRARYLSLVDQLVAGGSRVRLRATSQAPSGLSS
jgi:glycosyltransferase involved in cell wall biosynthesis